MEVDLLNPPKLGLIHRAARIIIVCTFFSSLFILAAANSDPKDAEQKLENTYAEMQITYDKLRSLPPSDARDEQIRKLEARLRD
jgi:hypothetical protein